MCDDVGWNFYQGQHFGIKKKVHPSLNIIEC